MAVKKLPAMYLSDTPDLYRGSLSSTNGIISKEAKEKPASFSFASFNSSVKDDGSYLETKMGVRPYVMIED